MTDSSAPLSEYSDYKIAHPLAYFFSIIISTTNEYIIFFAQM